MKRSSQHGSILVVLLLLLPIVILIVGFSVDVAHIQRVRTELSTATDLSAKAAADGLSQFQSETAARNLAIQIASQNQVAGQSLTLDPADVVFGRSDRQTDGSWDFTAAATPINSVRVKGSRTSGSLDGAVPAYFGTLYGHPEYEPEFEATSAFVDVDICVVLDRSSSMKLDVTDTSTGMGSSHSWFCLVPQPASRWMALDQAIATLISEINSSTGQEQLAVVTFATDYTSSCGESNSKVTIEQDLTTDMTLIQSAMNTRATTVWNGGTDLKEGIKKGREVLTGSNARPYAQKIMIVFSDGTYTGSDPMPEVTKAADQHDITVHAISFSAGANQTDMAAFALAGNGRHYHADTAPDLNAIFQELAASFALLVK